MARRKNLFVSIISSFLVELPSPMRISYIWNFGSMLAFCLGLQIVTGLFLAFHYRASLDLAFLRLVHLMRDVNYGWLIHFIHANGASLFFVCLYIHVGRGIYYSSYKMVHVWGRGIFILLVVMMTAFLGYVLPWGQMSFWGATVITNLVSAVPYLGGDIVMWLWGGYSVGGPTLVRFFAFHFLFPFLVVALVVVHLLFLHESGSSMPMGLARDYYRVEFHPLYRLRDLLGLAWLWFLFFIVRLLWPNFLGDRENFIVANPLVTPEHIQPEWYFLFAYAILRSIPNRLGGVVALVISILILGVCTIYGGRIAFSGWSWVWRVVFWFLVGSYFILTWIGARVVEDPYIVVGQLTTLVYFLIFFVFGAIRLRV